MVCCGDENEELCDAIIDARTLARPSLWGGAALAAVSACYILYIYIRFSQNYDFYFLGSPYVCNKFLHSQKKKK